LEIGNWESGISKTASRGFTFVEILLAVLITGLVMASLYGLLVSTIQVKEVVEKELDEVKAGAAAFDQIRRDLRLACALPDGRVFFKSGEGKVRGAGGGAGRVDFLAAVRNRFPPGFEETAFEEEDEDREDAAGALRGDLCEIGYFLQEADRETVLVRREDFYLDDDPAKGGVYMRLCRRVKAFELRFLAGDEADSGGSPAEEWDAEKEKALPFAVKVRLVIDRSAKEGDETEKVFEAVVPLLAGTRREEKKG
jgi:prepilin-type N-terminal cleavage/methylation domain-containing protein